MNLKWKTLEEHGWVEGEQALMGHLMHGKGIFLRILKGRLWIRLAFDPRLQFQVMLLLLCCQLDQIYPPLTVGGLPEVAEAQFYDPRIGRVEHFISDAEEMIKIWAQI